MLRSLLRTLPWFALWAVLVAGLYLGVMRMGGDERHVALRATSSALGRVVKPHDPHHPDHPPALELGEDLTQGDRIWVEYVGNRQQFRRDVGPEYLRGLRVGSEVMVYFDPSNPGLATLDDPRPEQQRTRNWILAALVIPIPLVLILWSLLSRRRQTSEPARAG